MSAVTISPFSQNIPNFQTTWDSTSLSWYKTCPRAYQYQMILQWEPRTRGIHLTFGLLYAASLERYSHARASGSSHDAATIRMVRWALENSGERDEEGVFTPWTPTELDANIKNRYTLVRSLVWNVEEREASPLSTLILANGRPAVELTFNLDAYTLHGEPIVFSGHLDEVVTEYDDSLWIRDDKTTKSALDANYFARYTPDNQMSMYSFAGKIILERPIRGVLVKGAQLGVTFTRFKTSQVPRPAAVLSEWFEDTKYYINQARENAIAGHWPMNDRSCFLCSFKKVCAVSPSHRDMWLKDEFVHRTWNPNESRGNI